MKVEYSVHDASLDQIPALAKRAEALGYDGVSTGETKSESMFKLLIAAEHTERVTVGSSVLIAFPRSPMVVAMQARDLQEFSGGRLLLGLGTQVKAHNERRFSTPWSSPGPRLREYVQSLRAIWDCWANGTKLSFEGDFYRFNLMTPYFTPTPPPKPQVPIYISALNPYNIRLAGEICDGIRMHGFNTPRYAREVILPHLEEGAKKAGRTLQDIDIVGTGFYITGANDDELERGRQEVKSRIAFYGSTPAYRSVLDLYGWGDAHEELHRLSREGAWAQMAEVISDEMVEEFAVIGSYDEIADKLKAAWSGISTRMGFDVHNRGPESDEIVQHVLTGLRS